MRNKGQLSLDPKGRAIMVLRVLSFDKPNSHLQHFSVRASSGARLNHIARSNGCGPENHRGNFGGFVAKTVFNCNVTFSDEPRRNAGVTINSGKKDRATVLLPVPLFNFTIRLHTIVYLPHRGCVSPVRGPLDWRTARRGERLGPPQRLQGLWV